METPNINIIKKQLLELSRDMKYQKALIIIDKYIRKNKETDWILLRKSFVLYHYAAALMYGDLNHPNKKKIISDNFKSAINICKKIINAKNDDSDIINARMYLAQIYVMLKQNTKAEKFAKQSYKYSPSAFSAERLADIYMRAENLNSAILWYRKAVKKTENYTEKLISQISLAVCYKKKNNQKQALKEAAIAEKYFRHSIKDTNAKILGKSLYENFPQLKKTTTKKILL